MITLSKRDSHLTYLGHVGNVGADSADSSLVFGGTHPLFNEDRHWASGFHFNLNRLLKFSRNNELPSVSDTQWVHIYLEGVVIFKDLTFK